MFNEIVGSLPLKWQSRNLDNMLGVKVEISRYIDNSQPGWVECMFIDAWGNPHSFVEKVPIVTSENLDASSSYPQSGIIACQVVEKRDANGREVVKIETDTPWHVESKAGESCFDVLPDQLIEFD